MLRSNCARQLGIIEMQSREYMALTAIGVATALLGLVGLFVEATAFGSVALAALLALSGVVGAIWNQ